MIKTGYKPCPFCGCEVMSITSEQSFKELIQEHGHAAISIQCYSCGLELWDHSNSIHYPDRVETIWRKWNRRAYEKTT